MMRLGTCIEEIDEMFEITEMPFGKYRGIEITNVPTSYLLYILNNMVDLDVVLKETLEKEIEDRKAQLPCFGTGYNSRSRACVRCPFAEECRINSYGEDYEADFSW